MPTYCIFIVQKQKTKNVHIPTVVKISQEKRNTIKSRQTISLINPELGGWPLAQQRPLC